MKPSTLARSAAVALALAFVGCSQRPADEAPTSRVLVAEIRVPQVTPGTALVAIVPDAKDGVANQNPPGTVEVKGGTIATDLTDANLCTTDAVYTPVTIKNFASETLGNAMVEFTSMTPVTHTVCNDQTGKLTGVTGQVIKYGDLAGSAVSNGTAAGGTGTVTWWFNYRTAEPFGFRAQIWADVTPAPPSGGMSSKTAYCPGGGCGIGLGVDPQLSWTGSTPVAYVAISDSAAFATTIEGAFVNYTTDKGGGLYGFTYTVTSTSAGQRWWRAYNRFAGSGGDVNGTFYTGGTYYVDGPPTNPKLYAWNNVLHDPTQACTFAASDFNTLHQYAPYPSADAPSAYNWITMYAETFAPQIELWTWGWWESHNGYFPHTRANPFIHHRTCSDITAGWLGGPRGAPSPAYAALFREPQVDTMDPQLADTVFGVMFCNQYGTLEDPTMQGTCTTTVYSAPGWVLPYGPTPVFTPSAAAVGGIYPAGTTITMTGGVGWSDPLFAPVQFYYTLDGTVPSTSSIHYTGPVALPSGASTRIRAMSAGSGFRNSLYQTDRTYTVAP